MPTSPLTLAQRSAREWRWWALVFVLLGLVLAVSLWQSRLQAERSERARLAQQARTVHDNVALQLKSIDRTLTGILGQLPRWRARGDEGIPLNERLNAFSDAMVGVTALNLVDAQGRVLASDRRELVDTDFSQRPYFITARQLQGEHLIVSPPFEPIPGLWVLTLARTVPGPDGGFGGVLAAALDAEAFRTLVQSVIYAPDMRAGLVHADGQRFIAQGADASLPGGANVRHAGLLFDRFRRSGQNSQVLQGQGLPGGKEYMAAYQLIAPARLDMDKPLVAAVVREMDAILAPWYSKVWLQTGLYGSALLLTALGLRLQQLRRRQLAAQEVALQERWQAVLEATGQGVWDYDLRTEKIFYSHVWKTMLGYDEADIGDSLSEWSSRVHPDDWDRAEKSWLDHLQGRTPVYECLHRIRCKDGHYQWILDRGRIIERDAAGQPLRVVGTKTDVTERRQLQERLDHLAENVPGMLYQFCLWPDGRTSFPYVSPGVQQIYGHSAEDLQHNAQAAFERIVPEDQERVHASVMQSALDLSPWRDLYRVQLPGCGERWLSGQAQPQRVEAGGVLWHGYIHDVTEQQQQTLKLQETERLLQHVLQEMPLALCMVDAQGQFYFRNRQFEEILGYPHTQPLTLLQWWQSVYPDAAYRQQVLVRWQQSLEYAAEHDGVIPHHEYHIHTWKGEARTMDISGLVFGGHFMAMFEDRTEQRAQQEALRRLAYVDGLTGIANRRHFDQQLQAEWRRCRRNQQPLALLLIDIDHFKQYNDHYGHPEGDACLQAVASTLKHELTRSHDLVARYGGEEFVCLLPESDHAGALHKAQQLLRSVQALGREHLYSSAAPVVTISVGLACLVPSAESSPEALLAQADASLYRAKQAGRNRVDAGADLLLKQ